MMDCIGDRARELAETRVFKKAENLYKRRFGFVPKDRLLQMVRTEFPEFQVSSLQEKIALRVRFNKEMSGQWSVPGSSMRKEKG